jgi:hypothetical protein
MKKRYVIALAVVAGFGLSAALAQTVQIPVATSIGQTDLTQIQPNGQPSGAQSIFFPLVGISGVESYSYQIPLTAFAITVPNHTSLMYINPAGTLATGAFTMEATPSDGQHICFEDTQIQTAVTISAGTGSTMLTAIGLGAVTAFAANTRYCYFYNRPLAGWIRYT